MLVSIEIGLHMVVDFNVKLKHLHNQLNYITLSR